MRLVLVFPPKASPTYMPLGIASLVPYVRTHVAGSSVRVEDTNIEAWHWLAERDAHGGKLLRYVQGKEGEFYDSRGYTEHRQTWKRLSSRLSHLICQAELYVTGGAPESGFMALLDFLTNRILSFDPELIGLSAVFPEQVLFSLALARRAKELSGAPGRVLKEHGTIPRIIMGGAAMSALRAGELLIACPWVDGIVMGEGEPAAAALCSGKFPDGVPGLVFRSATGIKRNSNSLTLSMRSLPAPDFSVFDFQRYFNPVPVIPVLFSRGCAWRKCRFCVHNISFSGYRTLGIDDFVSQLEDAQKHYGGNHFYFADQYVESRALDRIAERILEKDLSIRFHVMARPREDWSAERTEKLFKAGCRWICWGVESGSQRLLDLINKDTNVACIERVLGNAARAGISNLAMMIFGLPTSSDLDLRKTFQLLDNVQDSVDAICASSFVLWAQSGFGRSPGKYGMSVSGARVLLRMVEGSVHWLRFDYKERSADGSLRPPRGPVELAEWELRRKWLKGGETFLESLPCEHYLLHVSHHGLSRAKPGPLASDVTARTLSPTPFSNSPCCVHENC